MKYLLSLLLLCMPLCAQSGQQQLPLRPTMKHYLKHDPRPCITMANQTRPQTCAPAPFFTEDGFKVTFLFVYHRKFPITFTDRAFDLIVWKVFVTDQAGARSCLNVIDDIYSVIGSGFEPQQDLSVQALSSCN